MRWVFGPYSLSVLLACICSLVHPSHVAAQSADRGPLEVPHVDERVELLSIAFRSAGNPEYNMDTLPAYSADIDRYFAPYKAGGGLFVSDSSVNIPSRLRRG